MAEIMTAIKAKFNFSATTLKYIAIICMVLDHVACAFIPSYHPAYFVLRSIGRLTAPIMCFFVAEGYFKTSNLKRYILRLGAFAVISIVPFSLFESLVYGRIEISFGVIYTLLLGLLALSAAKSELNIFVKIITVLALILLSTYGDWPIFGVIYVLGFGLFRDSKPLSAIVFSFVTVGMALFFSGSSITYILLNMSALVALIPLLLYNGKRGGAWSPKFNKWFFYLFYPIHLLVLSAIIYIF